ncbi:MAG: hypothetical protein RL582_2 [Bacteroidota bacterium]
MNTQATTSPKQLLLKQKNASRIFFFRYILVVFFLIGITMIQPQKTQAQVTMSFQVFYDELSPHGTWVYNPDYGSVWVPNLNNQFYPYGSNGYWVFTEEGWTWVSLYSWGWAPFHYGRWFYDPFYRWVWVPGYQWGCAWVAWRQHEGYYGWTPIAPGISLTFAYSNYYEPQHDHWRFVHRNYLGRRDMNQHVTGFSGYVNYLKNSTAINNVRDDRTSSYKYHAGPIREEMEKNTGKKIRPVPIVSAPTPLQKHQSNKLIIYRPQIKETDQNQPVPQPKKLDVWKGHTPTRDEIKGEPNMPRNENPSIERQKEIEADNKAAPINPKIIQETHEPKRELDRRIEPKEIKPVIREEKEKPKMPKPETPRVKTELVKPIEKQKQIQSVVPKVDKPIKRTPIIKPQQPQIKSLPKQVTIQKTKEKAIKNLRKEP